MNNELYNSRIETMAEHIFSGTKVSIEEVANISFEHNIPYAKVIMDIKTKHSLLLKDHFNDLRERGQLIE